MAQGFNCGQPCEDQIHFTNELIYVQLFNHWSQPASPSLYIICSESNIKIIDNQYLICKKEWTVNLVYIIDHWQVRFQGLLLLLLFNMHTHTHTHTNIY